MPLSPPDPQACLCVNYLRKCTPFSLYHVESLSSNPEFQATETRLLPLKPPGLHTTACAWGLPMSPRCNFSVSLLISASLAFHVAGHLRMSCHHLAGLWLIQDHRGFGGGWGVVGDGTVQCVKKLANIKLFSLLLLLLASHYKTEDPGPRGPRSCTFSGACTPWFPHLPPWVSCRASVRTDSQSFAGELRAFHT